MFATPNKQKQIKMVKLNLIEENGMLITNLNARYLSIKKGSTIHDFDINDLLSMCDDDMLLTIEQRFYE